MTHFCFDLSVLIWFSLQSFDLNFMFLFIISGHLEFHICWKFTFTDFIGYSNPFQNINAGINYLTNRVNNSPISPGEKSEEIVARKETGLTKAIYIHKTTKEHRCKSIRPRRDGVFRKSTFILLTGLFRFPVKEKPTLKRGREGERASEQKPSFFLTLSV